MRTHLNMAKYAGRQQRSMGMGFGNLGVRWESCESGLPLPFHDERTDVTTVHRSGMET